MPEIEPLYRPRLHYPERALRLRREGRVIVEFHIGSDGAPHDVRVIEAIPPGLFEQSALRYAAGLRYTPEGGREAEGLEMRERLRQRLVVRFEMRGQA